MNSFPIVFHDQLFKYFGTIVQTSFQSRPISPKIPPPRYHRVTAAVCLVGFLGSNVPKNVVAPPEKVPKGAVAVIISVVEEQTTYAILWSTKSLFYEVEAHWRVTWSFGKERRATLTDENAHIAIYYHDDAILEFPRTAVYEVDLACKKITKLVLKTIKNWLNLTRIIKIT